MELELRLSSDGIEVPCAKAYLRQFQSRQGHKKTSDEVTLLRYAVLTGPGKRRGYVPGQYPSLDDLAQGPHAPLRKSAVRYYGQKLPRSGNVTMRVLKARPAGWRKPTKGVLQRIHLACEVHHILPVVVLWNLAKSMLQTIVMQPDAPDAQAIALINKMKLAGFYMSDELGQLVVEHHHQLNCPQCQPSGPMIRWSLDNIETDTEPAEQRAVQAAEAAAAAAAAGVEAVQAAEAGAAEAAPAAAAAGVEAAANQAALLPHARLIREEDRRLITCLIPNSQRLVLLDMLPADVARLLQMTESERQTELTQRVQQTDDIQAKLRHMFEVEWQQQQQAGTADAAEQGGVGEVQQQQQQQQQQEANADVAQ